jgi:hypothetical protein
MGNYVDSVWEFASERKIMQQNCNAQYVMLLLVIIITIFSPLWGRVFYYLIFIIIMLIYFHLHVWYVQEAKNAFKALLESANVQSDWTWEQVSLLFIILTIYFLH